MSSLSTVVLLSAPGQRGGVLSSYYRDLSRSLLVNHLRKALSAAGLKPECYAVHSFRIGAATTAAACGVPVEVIKTLGRWRSEAY